MRNEDTYPEVGWNSAKTGGSFHPRLSSGENVSRYRSSCQTLWFQAPPSALLPPIRLVPLHIPQFFSGTDARSQLAARPYYLAEARNTNERNSLASEQLFSHAQNNRRVKGFGRLRNGSY